MTIIYYFNQERVQMGLLNSYQQTPFKHDNRNVFTERHQRAELM